MTGSIFIDENIPFLKDILSQSAAVHTFKGRELSSEMLIKYNCVALFTRSTTKVNSKLLDGTSVEFVATATSGIDHIDTDYLNSKNIYFASALGSNSNSVAEYVIYSILKWSELNNISLSDKSIGIIGYGNIGKKVAYYANCIGLKVYVNDPPLNDSNFKFPDYMKYSELDNILSNCDIITNHVPLDFATKYKTENLFNSNNLELLKEKSLFIHCSRGKIVNEEALISIINKKNISLVIDVFSDEPISNEFLAERAFIATPHIAGYSKDGKILGVMMCLEAFEKYFSLVIDSEILKSQLKKDFISLDLNSENFYDIYLNIKKLREIDTDSSLFKEKICINKLNDGAEFDNLRKTYPSRREYLTYKSSN